MFLCMKRKEWAIFVIMIGIFSLVQYLHFSNGTYHDDVIHEILPASTTTQIPSYDEPSVVIDNVTMLKLKSWKRPDLTAQVYRTEMDIIQHRLDHAKQKCTSYNSSSYWQSMKLIGTIWSYNEDNLHYCMTPKVACTFWKGILRYIAHDYPDGNNITGPSGLDRFFINTHQKKNIVKEWKISDSMHRQAVVNGKNFMFTRDPYARLWSAYIDKFLLPDFWRYKGISVIKSQRARSNRRDVLCGNNVSFKEFVQFVVSGVTELHWSPLHMLCSPCHMKYDVIAKVETFTADTKLIFQRYGIQDYLKSETRLEHAKNEIHLLVKYNFGIQSRHLKPCYDIIDVAKRLWKTFQYNGYIHNSFNMSTHNLQSIGLLAKQKTLQERVDFYCGIVYEALTFQTIAKLDPKPQRYNSMVEAYRNLPIKLLKKLELFYKYDFELFEYDSHPNELFRRE